MFEHPLPKRFKPAKIARQEGRFEGYMPISELPALAQDCVEQQGKVTAQLSMQMSEGYPTLQGTAEATISMTCQRCLDPVAIKLSVDVSLGFVPNEEQAGRLSSGFEPFIQHDEEVLLSEVLEQELILALPIVAYHDHCSQQDYEQQQEPPEAAEPKQNPFAVLEQLKDDVKKTDR